MQTPTNPSVLIRNTQGNIAWEEGSNGQYLSVQGGEPSFTNLPDGSISNPISYPLLQQNTGTTDARLITQQNSGVLRNWRPSGSSATPRLLNDKNGQWEVETINNLLPSGQGLIIRDTSNNLVVVPNGVSGASLQMVGTNIQFVAAPANQFPGGHLYGLTISNNVSDPNNDLDISVGECRSATNTTDLILTAGLTKLSDAPWAAGNNVGGMDVGVKPNNGTLHVYVIGNGSTVDVIFSQSAISPALPGGYTQYRRIGAVTTDGTGSIRRFVQFGDRFLYTGKPIADLAPGTVAAGGTLIPLTVPAGIKVSPIINGFEQNTNVFATFYDPDSTWPSSNTPQGSNGAGAVLLQKNALYSGFAPLFGLMTNTVRQIGIDTNSQSSAYYLDTYGWFDQRGRLQP